MHPAICPACGAKLACQHDRFVGVVIASVSFVMFFFGLMLSIYWMSWMPLATSAIASIGIFVIEIYLAPLKVVFEKNMNL